VSDRWVAFSEPQLQVSLEHPADWRVEYVAANKIALIKPDESAWLAVSLLTTDCEAARSEAATVRSPNVYLVGEGRRILNGQEATQIRFLDSIAMVRETTLFVPRNNRCLLLEYGFVTGSGATEAEQQLDTIISTVRLIGGASRSEE
jgi:hypothetical protein